MSDRGPRPDGQFRTGGHIGLANPADPTSQQVVSLIEDFTSYKNRNGGVWARGEMSLFKNLKMADNAIGYTHASANFGQSAYTSRVIDSLFVGETDNIGNPTTAAEKAYGRSLPQPTLADFPIRGYEFYDLRHELDNVTFVNFKDNATRKTGAVSYLLFTSYGMSTNNTIQRAKFVNAKPVYFPPLERKWGNDDAGSGSYRTSVFHDLDGSVGGVPNSFIVINGGIAADEACELKPTWNASVCKGDIGRMTVGATRGGGGPGAAVAAPRVAGAPPAALPPVTLTRNGKDYTLTGETNVRAGSEFKVSTDRPTVALNVKELESGSWVIFELPGFTAATEGTEQSSLDALRTATSTSYYKSNGALWVKLVSTGDVLGSGSGKGPGGGVTLTASR
jgi:cell migration-inducing and hyaluronan-binding protein